jgi:2'-5' RNA ligase
LWLTSAERQSCVEVSRARLPRNIGRRSLPQDLHLTLLFLGQVSAIRQSRLEVLLQQVHAAPFRLRLTSLQCWHGGRVCCLTAGMVPALRQLHRSLQVAARRAGMLVEAQALQPHVTLARDVPRALAATIAGDVPAICLTVNAFCLVASEPRAQAARYRVLRRWPLRR